MYEDGPAMATRNYASEDAEPRRKMTMAEQMQEMQARIASLQKEVAELNHRLGDQNGRLAWAESELGR